MISSVYSYYLSQYGNKSNSKYDSHTRTQLKNTYSKVVKINSQTPVYKLDLSTAAQKYAIDLKEHARALENITEDLSDGADGTMTFKKSAVSSNASAVNASYITDFGAASDDEIFDINVKQLACSQLNTGNYLQPRSKHIKPGEYSFDLSINDVIYEFQFKVDNSETTNNIQNKIARLINRSNIGLTANIKEDNLGNTAINIESEATGINGTTPVIFSIKSDDASNQPLIDTLGIGVRIMRRERRNGVIMSESYAVNEKRELILQKVKEFIVAHGGIVKKNQLEELHIDYRRILDFVEKGDLIRIKSGYYTIRIGDYSEDELIVKLFPDAVLTMECALYAYGYIKRKPYGYQIAVDKNTSKSRFKLEFPQVTPFYAEPETLQSGVDRIDFGNAKMQIFDKDRLICECLKYEDKMERAVFQEGVLSYIKDEKKNIANLMKYARERRVVKKVQSMIGVWL